MSERAALPSGPPETLGVLLAAGASRRFGAADKLLANWQGMALVRVSAQILACAGCDRLAAVVSRPEVGAALPDGFSTVSIAPGQEMAASFHAALDLAAQIGAKRLLIALGDMPRISPLRLRALLSLPGRGAVLCADGRRMPPVLLQAKDFAQARALATGDHGARALLARFTPSELIALPEGEALDIDLATDLALADQPALGTGTDPASPR
ncbi:nucleotidyltransferase family protein [Paracoccus aminophilus]|uniref:Molybdopterin-guanine dinucleotide biosynthesis protein A n=1 Tax=Paracoccus aminophilus JCM 7686 TaxID=1367847 RepID=S5XM15_PARAH|nr:NTP transferase domain-containing protein [Paracoccus aminophilus]AGT08314.1 molybdopterin-guanine dinucleotide biosynthesis protein A [Paracoccus aminophilus JCM 7686]